MIGFSLLGSSLLTALAAGAADAPLVARDRVQLRLAGAETILTAANAVGDTAVQEAIRAMAPAAGGTAP